MKKDTAKEYSKIGRKLVKKHGLKGGAKPLSFVPETPQKDIDAALQIERDVPDDKRGLYLIYMNGKPMSERTEPQEVRDGCILSHLYNNYGGSDDE